MKKVEHISYF